MEGATITGFLVNTTTNNNGDLCDQYFNISLNPQFVSAAANNFNLLSYSPCIDAGDPELPMDPDNTIADQGAYYCVQGPPPAMLITMTPANPPISIPATGGSFDYNIEIENLESTTAVFDVWIDVTLPSSAIFGPVINVQGVQIAANQTIDRDKSQNVPAGAPDGAYFYNGYVGNYPNEIYSQDSFSFNKECTDGSAREPVHEWYCWGEEFDNQCQDAHLLVSEYALLSAYPNPFNPQTTLSISLPDANFASLVIYDITGREISRLLDGWYSAGVHEVTFAANSFASGTYFAQMTTGDVSKTLKLMLIK